MFTNFNQISFIIIAFIFINKTPPNYKENTYMCYLIKNYEYLY